MTTTSEINHIMERLGTEATADDAQLVADIAADLAREQGDTGFELLDWLHNRTYD